MRIILFDIDGTLILSGGAGLLALQKAFGTRYGVTDPTDGVEFHGRTDPLILEAIAERHLGRPFHDGEAETMAAEYLSLLPVFLKETHYQILEGVPELLDHLSGQDGLLLGLATGNYEEGAWAKLRQGGLDRYFEFGGFGSDHPNRDELTKRALQRALDRGGSPEGVVVVGDTIHDVGSALAAGADCLGVATGNASEETLAAAGARWTVPTLADPRVREILAP
ncbi:MAG: hypothetical protein DHS20C21_04450 [Gemmatimonadota bacterium]|nr:MAG: hypothetical protein DHS20C21_04450 [Gemmatimonadota bacterium]